MEVAQVSAQRPHRLEYFDGLRGVAALIVFLSHFTGFFLVNYNLPSSGHLVLDLTRVSRCLLNGGFAVYIFFTLSGFVLAQSAANGKGTLPARLLARYLRLTIPMTLSLVFAWGMLLVFAQTRLELDHSAHADMVRSYLFVQAPPFSEPIKEGLYLVYWKGASTLNSVVWTMKSELIGSILVYLFYRFCPVRFRLAGLALWLSLNLMLGGYTVLAFALGVSLREAWIRGVLPDNRFSWLGLALGFWISASVDLHPRSLEGALHPVTFLDFLSAHSRLVYALGAGALVYAIATLAVLRQALSTSIPRFLGRISFSFYLIHIPICILAMNWLYLRLPLDRGWKLGIVFTTLLLLSVSLAWVMTLYVDEPLTRRLRRLTALNPAAPAASPVVGTVP